MPSLRDIRQKIKSVTATQQITNAMKMMSTARLSRAVEAVNQTKPYITKLLSLAQRAKANIGNFNHPALASSQANKTITVIIGGERGLCGSFNQDLHRFAYEQINKTAYQKQKIYVIGKKPIRFFQLTKVPIAKTFQSLNMKDLEPELFSLAQELYQLFITKETDSISIIYTSYISSANHPIVCHRLLPLASDSALESNSRNSDRANQMISPTQKWDFYPSPEIIFEKILSRYMYNSLFKAVLESVAAEQCARMTAMTSATDRANEKLEDLRLEHNRSRQAQITQELIEVISGSQNN